MYLRILPFLKRRFILTRFIIGCSTVLSGEILVCFPNILIKFADLLACHYPENEKYSYIHIFMNTLLTEYAYRFGSGLARVIYLFSVNTSYAVLLSIPLLVLIWSINLKAKYFVIAFAIAGLLVIGPVDYELLARIF